MVPRTPCWRCFSAPRMYPDSCDLKSGQMAQTIGLARLLDEMDDPSWVPNPDLFVGAPALAEIKAPILRTVDFCAEANISAHPFFARCQVDARAIRLWLAQ